MKPEEQKRTWQENLGKVEEAKKRLRLAEERKEELLGLQDRGTPIDRATLARVEEDITAAHCVLREARQQYQGGHKWKAERKRSEGRRSWRQKK